MAEGRAQRPRLRVPHHRPQGGRARARADRRGPDVGPRLGFNALNVTHPCKQLVIPHLDELDDAAAALGAVNTVSSTTTGRSATTPTPPASPPDSPRACPAPRSRTSCCSGRAERAPRSGTPCSTSAPTTSRSSTSTSTAPPPWPASWRRRHPDARVDASAFDKLVGAAAGQRRRRALHADRHGRPSRPAVRRRAAAPGSVGRRHRLPPTEHRAAERGARRPDAAPSTAATWPCTRPPPPSN